MKKILSALLMLVVTTISLAQEKAMTQSEITSFKKEVISKTKEITRYIKRLVFGAIPK